MKTFDEQSLFLEYRWDKESPLDRWFRVKKDRALAFLTFTDNERELWIAQVAALEADLQGLADFDLAKRVWQSQRALRMALEEKNLNCPDLIQAIAVIRELSLRILGMRHHDVQLLGAAAMLMGRIAEMQTGEGKSLTALPTAVIAAIAGYPVHIITVNEYLAERDAKEFTVFFNALGLEVGLIQEDQSPEERRIEYRKSVVYLTNKDVAFDYLKDKIKFPYFEQRGRHLLSVVDNQSIAENSPVLAGLHFALIDEVDSVLTDEAGTPLIISRNCDGGNEELIYRQAMEFAVTLEQEVHFTIDHNHKLISWLPGGMTKLAEISSDLGGVWRGAFRARELMAKALSALYLYHPGKQYAVHEDKIQIIDEYTGRRMPDRSWEGGLHQFIEIKEGVELTPPRETLAKTTYQRFFRRYWRVAGMSGTVSEIADELNATYGLVTEVIPTHHPSKREQLSPHIFANNQQKNQYLLDSLVGKYKLGQPVLVGTRSIADSQALSRLLNEKGIEHKVLNAVQDLEEAEIVSQAGQLSQITVATNMAGRGTDIKLSAAVKQLGGLHVICSEPHDSRRIDRQLFGRCARQGDPGSYQLLCSFEDEIPCRFLSSTLIKLGQRLARINQPWSKRLVLALIWYAQARAEKRNYLMRYDLAQMDERINKSLGFTGIIE